MSNEHAAFSPTIIDHFLHPRNSGSLEDPTVRVELLNEICGDQMALALTFKDGVITDARFRSFGCAVAIATASLVTEAVKGKSLAEAESASQRVFKQVAEDTHGEKEHCRSMVARAWQQAAEQIRRMR